MTSLADALPLSLAMPRPAGTASRHGGLVSELGSGLESLHPAYFAMVMATGIVSVASMLLGMPLLAGALYGVNLVAYAALWGLTVARLLLYPRRAYADLIDHQRGVGFFTAVAATSVLGVQSVIVRRDYASATALWLFALALWLLLVYTVFTAFTIKETKPSLADGINGGWLVAVVATESISNLGGLLVPHFEGSDHETLLFFSLVFWLCGGMLYIWMISLIFYRYTFFKFSPADLMPPYWINMGAMAISTLAGTTLIANAARSVLLQKMLPFLLGFTALFWATATWWIPMLLILAVWRHGVKRLPVTYDPLYWGAVFPLGMYAVCTLRMAQVMELPFLLPVPRVFVYLALAGWSAAFAGLARSLIRTARRAFGVSAHATA
jgi:tellurite resistance protein TehA-like permease